MVYFDILVTIQRQFINAQYRDTSKVANMVRIGVSTMFILIEARRASAGISPSETMLICGENNYCDRNTTYPLYITSYHCYMTY